MLDHATIVTHPPQKVPTRLHHVPHDCPKPHSYGDCSLSIMPSAYILWHISVYIASIGCTRNKLLTRRGLMHLVVPIKKTTNSNKIDPFTTWQPLDSTVTHPPTKRVSKDSLCVQLLSFFNFFSLDNTLVWLLATVECI